jgi:glutaminyl-tRNA synthetase
MGFFTGQVMRATNGQADAKAVARLLGEMLG